MTRFSNRTQALILLLLPLLIYGSGVGRDFLFDDLIYIAENPLLRRSDALRVFWFTSDAFNYYPLFWSLLRIQWLLWSDHSTGYHLVNLLVHSANAILIWQIGRAWRLPGAWWAAALFAVHPINVQTIAWAAEQKNTWSFLFMALALLTYIKHTTAGRWQTYSLSILSFIAALACKTSVVSLPFFLAICYAFNWSGVNRRPHFFRLLPFFLLSVGAGLTTLWFEHHRAGSSSGIASLGLGERLVTAGAAFWYYLGKALIPLHLTPMYAGWVDTTACDHTVIPLLLLVLLITVCGLWWRRIGPVVTLGIIYYVVMLLPMLGMFDTNYFVYSLIADHWQYHALPGLLFAITAAIVAIAKEHRQLIRVAKLSALSTTFGFGALATLHFAHFEDASALWQYVVSRNENAWIAWYNLGNTYFEEHEYSRATAAFYRSIQIKPTYYRSRFNLANTLAAAGRFREAERAYGTAQRIRSDDPDAYNNRAVTLLQLGQEDQAVVEFNRALQLEPGKASANFNLVLVFLRKGQPAEAEAYLQKGIVSTDANCRRIADVIEASWDCGPFSKEITIRFLARACQLSGRQRDLVKIYNKLIDAPSA